MRICRVVRARISSSTITPTPIRAPMRIRLQSMSAAMTPWASDEIKPACGPGEDTDDKRELLLPRSGLDELAGLEVLQVIVRDCGHIEDHRGGEKRESH